jgi:hypothetical protein
MSHYIREDLISGKEKIKTTNQKSELARKWKTDVANIHVSKTS